MRGWSRQRRTTWSRSSTANGAAIGLLVPCLSATRKTSHPSAVRSVQEVGGVEKHLLDALALLTSEPCHTESLTLQLARALSPTFEIPAAGAATMSEMVVDLAERGHRDGERGRRPGPRPGEATQARSSPAASRQRQHRGGQR